MIMACVERSVDSIEMAYLRAYYGHELHNGDLARIVMDILVQAVVGSLGTGLHKRRGIQKLILNYFGHDIAFRHIRTELACSLDNANKMRIQVYDALSDLGARAERDAENALYNAGIIKE